MKVITALGFGSIEHLSITGGEPCYTPPPRVVQQIKLGSAPSPSRRCETSNLPVKKEFEELFNHLNGMARGFVNIEVRHGLPFMLALELDQRELVP